MAIQDSNTEEIIAKLEVDMHSLGLMIKGFFDLVGTGIEHVDVDALNNAYSRLYSSYKEYAIAANVGVHHGI